MSVTPIVVAGGDLEKGDRLNKRNVWRRLWPSNQVSKDILLWKDRSRYFGNILVRDMTSLTPITAQDLTRNVQGKSDEDAFTYDSGCKHPSGNCSATKPELISNATTPEGTKPMHFTVSMDEKLVNDKTENLLVDFQDKDKATLFSRCFKVASLKAVETEHKMKITLAVEEEFWAEASVTRGKSASFTLKPCPEESN